MGRWFAEVERDTTYGPWPALGRALLVGATAIGVSRVVQAFSVEASPAIAHTVAILVCGAALCCLAALCWAFWHSWLDTERPGPLMASLMISLGSLGLLVEAFAGLSTVMWRDGVARAPGTPSLWAVEHYYLWHLANSVPVLRLPSTFDWPDPHLFADQASGALLLVFKIVTIAPLVRIGVAAVRTSLARAVIRDARIQRKVWRPGSRTRPHRAAWRRWVGTVATAGLGVSAYAIFLVAWSPSGWLLSRVRPQWVPGISNKVDAVLALLVIGVALAALATLELHLDPVDSAGALLRWIARAILAAAFAFLTGVVLITVFVALGWARFDSAVPPSHRPTAVLLSSLWHLADAMPGPNIPQTVGWELKNNLDGWVSGLMLVVTKIGVVLPLLLVIRALVDFRNRQLLTARAANRLLVPGEIGTLLADVHDGLDRLQQTYLGDRLGELARSREYRVVDGKVDRLHDMTIDLGSSMGTEFAALAERAEQALHERLRALWGASIFTGISVRDAEVRPGDLAQLREREVEAIQAYACSVAEALHGAADIVQARMPRETWARGHQ